jgi:hypothetical protein
MRREQKLLWSGRAWKAVLVTCISCSGGGMLPEKRCGQSPDTYFSAHTVEDLERYSDCTVLVGHFQEDSVAELKDLAALRNVTRIEGYLNVFRSPGFLTLRGLDNLETVDGHVAIHSNPNLISIAALGKLRTVTGNLFIGYNDQLPQTEVERIGSNVTVGGETTLAKSAAP